jgi:predicted signal transduction protein with EAL and GGDEF domain
VRDLQIPHASSQTQPHVTISVGIVSVDAYRVLSHDVAVGLADQALYAAKHQGRDRHVAYDQAALKVDLADTTVLPLRSDAPLREASSG